MAATGAPRHSPRVSNGTPAVAQKVSFAPKVIFLCSIEIVAFTEFAGAVLGAAKFAAVGQGAVVEDLSHAGR